MSGAVIHVDLRCDVDLVAAAAAQARADDTARQARIQARSQDIYASLLMLLARYEHDGIPNDTQPYIDDAQALVDEIEIQPAPAEDRGADDESALAKLLKASIAVQRLRTTGSAA